MDMLAFNQVNEVVKLEDGKLPQFEQTLFYKHASSGRIVHGNPVQAGDFIAKASPGFNGWSICTYFVLSADLDMAEIKPCIAGACPIISSDDDSFLEDYLQVYLSGYVYEQSQYPHKIVFHEVGFEQEDALEYQIPYNTIIVDAAEIVKAGELSVKATLAGEYELDDVHFCYVKEGMILAIEENGSIKYQTVQAVHRYEGLFVLCDLPESDVDPKFIVKIKQAMQEQKEYLTKTKTLKEFLS